MQTYQTGFTTTLAEKFESTDVTAVVATAPTVTSGRFLIKSGNVKSWINFTGVTGTTLTGVTFVSQTAVPATTVAGNTFVAGTRLSLVAMHDQLIDKQQGTQVQGFTSAQRTALSIPANTSAIVLNTDSGVLEQYIGGSWQTFATGTTPNASATVAGKVEIATSAQSIAGTDTGETGALLSVLPSDIAKNVQSSTFVYGADAGGDDTYVVALTPALAAYTTGQVLYMKVTTANAGACTVDFGPGAKSIKDRDGNDPVTGQVYGTVCLQYDGTNMVLQTAPTLATDAQATAGTSAINSITPAQFASRSRYVDKKSTAGTSSSTDETTVYTGTITGGHLGTTGSVRVTGTYSYPYASGASSVTGTIRVKLGGTTFATLSVNSNATNDSAGSAGSFSATIMNNASASVQKSFACADGAHVGTASGVTSYGITKDTQTGAVNTASDQTLLVTAQSSSAAFTLTIDALLVEIIR